MFLVKVRLKLWLAISTVFILNPIFAQDSTLKFFDQPTLRYVGYTAGVYGVSMVGLHQLWYKDYPRSKFHFFNDNDEWNQLDKAGHVYSSYVLSRINSKILGDKLGKGKRLLLAGSSTLIFLTSIEIFDGYSQQWGFSTGDAIANFSGVVLFSLQEYYLNKQYIKLKYSYHNTSYRQIRPELLGENWLQGAFKDYNGQTYWANVNLNNLSKNIKPQWLSLSFGFGAEGMLYAHNRSIDQSYRQYYLSFDIDFDKIPTKSKWVEGLFLVLDCIKMPFPAVEFVDGQKAQIRPFMF